MEEQNMFRPRFRGQTFEMENIETNESCGFGFEIFLFDEAGTTNYGSLGQFGPYPTEKDAHTEMMGAIKLVCEEYGKLSGQGIPEGYVDLKNGGQFRPFEVH